VPPTTWQLWHVVNNRDVAFLPWSHPGWLSDLWDLPNRTFWDARQLGGTFDWHSLLPLCARPERLTSMQAPTRGQHFDARSANHRSHQGIEHGHWANLRLSGSSPCVDDNGAHHRCLNLCAPDQSLANLIALAAKQRRHGVDYGRQTLPQSSRGLAGSCSCLLDAYFTNDCFAVNSSCMQVLRSLLSGRAYTKLVPFPDPPPSHSARRYPRTPPHA